MREVMIESKKLCKSFASGKENTNVIKNLDLKIYKDDFTVIMGSSGSGKSTLLYLLSGMDDATSGEILIENKEITKLNEKEKSILRTKNIGFIFQSINLLPDLNVRDNILIQAIRSLGNKKIANSRTNELLERVGLKEHERKFPSEISGGQKQRVGLCRAIVTDPNIVFADEPTGALNSAQGIEVLDLLTKLHEEGRNIVMVTHDIKAAIRANRVIFLKDGRIEGELNLSKYSKENSREREMEIFNFLNNNEW